MRKSDPTLWIINLSCRNWRVEGTCASGKKDEEEESKLYETFEIAPPVSSPEDKEKTKQGTTIIVMPTVTTDNVINPNVLQTEESQYIPKLENLSICDKVRFLWQCCNDTQSECNIVCSMYCDYNHRHT